MRTPKQLCGEAQTKALGLSVSAGEQASFKVGPLANTGLQLREILSENYPTNFKPKENMTDNQWFLFEQLHFGIICYTATVDFTEIHY